MKREFRSLMEHGFWAACVMSLALNSNRRSSFLQSPKSMLPPGKLQPCRASWSNRSFCAWAGMRRAAARRG